MTDRETEVIAFECPGCRSTVSVPRGDRDSIRRIGSRKNGPLLIRVYCSDCQRLIVQTVMTESRSD